jgi:hypothetical protein
MFLFQACRSPHEDRAIFEEISKFPNNGSSLFSSDCTTYYGKTYLNEKINQTNDENMESTGNFNANLKNIFIFHKTIYSQ